LTDEAIISTILDVTIYDSISGDEVEMQYVQGIPLRVTTDVGKDAKPFDIFSTVIGKDPIRGRSCTIIGRDGI
jgi:hypothetical protein